ncbi:MAG TPA: sulfatase-like hydrolase/transferase [Gaiellaceae bacterium]|nr:sulfatase-like hydrolase/transferase [Gaiellaceae bacterium]
MTASRPNVVIVVADDLGYGDLGQFNEGRCSSPTLDALAQEGICLTQHYSGSPVCAPARAALLTGRYPHRTGAIDTLQGRGLDRIALGEVTLADHFRAAGYRTGLIGKWHNGDLDARYHPNARGFEEFVGFSGGYSDYYDYTLDVNGSRRSGDGRYLTDVLSERAVAFVQRHAAEPFFLMVAYNAPHFPMQAPQELVDRYLEQGETLGAALTYAMIEVMDAGVGRIDETLHDLGLAENTFFMFTSDNGPYLGEVAGVSLDRFNYGFRGAKHYVFEGGIRVPAIVRWPAAIAGGRLVPEMLHFTDWLPTLAAAARLPSPEAGHLDGHDVGAVLNGDSSEVDPVRFWQNNRYGPRVEGNAAMRDGNWKLVRPTIPELMRVTDSDRAIDRALNHHQPDRISHVDTSPLPEFDVGDPPAALLFDVAADPFEQDDLAVEQPERVARMTKELERWFESVEADRTSIPDDWNAVLA